MASATPPHNIRSRGDTLVSPHAETLSPLTLFAPGSRGSIYPALDDFELEPGLGFNLTKEALNALLAKPLTQELFMKIYNSRFDSTASQINISRLVYSLLLFAAGIPEEEAHTAFAIRNLNELNTFFATTELAKDFTSFDFTNFKAQAIKIASAFTSHDEISPEMHQAIGLILAQVITAYLAQINSTDPEKAEKFIDVMRWQQNYSLPEATVETGTSTPLKSIMCPASTTSFAAVAAATPLMPTPDKTIANAISATAERLEIPIESIIDSQGRQTFQKPAAAAAAAGGGSSAPSSL